MPTYGSGPCIALTKVLASLAFRDRYKETVGCYGALVGSDLSIRAENMQSIHLLGQLNGGLED